MGWKSKLLLTLWAVLVLSGSAMYIRACSDIYCHGPYTEADYIEESESLAGDHTLRPGQ